MNTRIKIKMFINYKKWKVDKIEYPQCPCCRKYWNLTESLHYKPVPTKLNKATCASCLLLNEIHSDKSYIVHRQQIKKNQMLMESI